MKDLSVPDPDDSLRARLLTIVLPVVVLCIFPIAFLLMGNMAGFAATANLPAFWLLLKGVSSNRYITLPGDVVQLALSVAPEGTTREDVRNALIGAPDVLRTITANHLPDLKRSAGDGAAERVIRDDLAALLQEVVIGAAEGRRIIERGAESDREAHLNDLQLRYPRTPIAEDEETRLEE